MSTRVEVRRGFYRDSVTLMQVSRQVAAVEGVEAAVVAMATGLNLDVLATSGFERPEGAGPNDLVLAVRAVDDAAVDAGMAAADVAMRAGAPGSGGGTAVDPPRTVGAAARTRADATLALVSVPGPAAFVEAMDAVESGLHVMLFSDNVTVEHEVALKEAAAGRGLLVMGPDCGTAVVAGAGLGFANVVRPGRVGIVAASGTGAQQVMCLLDAAGAGTSHCLGVGGRDLSTAVGGRSTHQALDLLDADTGTDLVLVVSKPPAATVARSVREHVARMSTPVVLALLGPNEPDLTSVVESVLGALGIAVPEWPATLLPPARRRNGLLRGLFSGGTLCDEAMLVARQTLGAVASNIPLPEAPPLGAGLVEPGSLRGAGHAMVDFGDDRLTAGRPHPMIDLGLRASHLADCAADPDVGVVLLDVVLGWGAHPDPAAELAPVVAAATGDDSTGGPAVVVSLVGTDADPQGLSAQRDRLVGAGAAVFASNAAATRYAVSLTAGAPRGA